MPQEIRDQRKSTIRLSQSQFILCLSADEEEEEEEEEGGGGGGGGEGGGGGGR